MFKHFLVPLDGSHLAEAVLPPAVVLAKRFDARITLLHVLEVGPPQTIHGEPHITNATQAEGYLAKIAADIRDEGIPVDFHVHPNLERNVPHGIADHAADWGADLIVICTHGSSGLRHTLVGSIAQQVLQIGQQPVFLVRPSRSGGPPPFACQRLLLPLDGRPEHEASLAPAEAIAQLCGATLKLLVVVPTLDTERRGRSPTAIMSPRATAAVLDVQEEQSCSYLSRLGGELQQRGLNVSAEVRRGDPAKVMVEVAQSLNADLVILATHGRAGLDALWSGSVAPRVLGHLRQPVLLVRATGTAPALES